MVESADHPTVRTEELPYQVELVGSDGAGIKVLARAASAQLARAIYNAAKNEHAGARIRLSRDNRVIADSAGGD
jgi:hypothetical protein